MDERKVNAQKIANTFVRPIEGMEKGHWRHLEDFSSFSVGVTTTIIKITRKNGITRGIISSQFSAIIPGSVV